MKFYQKQIEIEIGFVDLAPPEEAAYFNDLIRTYLMIILG